MRSEGLPSTWPQVAQVRLEDEEGQLGSRQWGDWAGLAWGWEAAQGEPLACEQRPARRAQSPNPAARPNA